MTTLREVQYNARRMLLCNGPLGHTADVPRIRGDGVTSSDVRCEECGEPMLLVDVITVDSCPTLSSLAYDRSAPLYTTAKLNPLALLAAANRGEVA